MPVDTAKVTGRRNVHYTSYDELLADADRVGANGAKTLGNWSAGQIFQHLSIAMNGSIDGFGYTFPWPMRLMAKVFRKKLFTDPMPAGMKMPADFAKVVMPPPTSTEAGLANLRAAVARLQREPKRVPHPVFGDVTREEWDMLHFKHANLHMSYLIPQ